MEFIAEHAREQKEIKYLGSIQHKKGTKQLYSVNERMS